MQVPSDFNNYTVNFKETTNKRGRTKFSLNLPEMNKNGRKTLRILSEWKSTLFSTVIELQFMPANKRTHIKRTERSTKKTEKNYIKENIQKKSTLSYSVILQTVLLYLKKL